MWRRIKVITDRFAGRSQQTPFDAEVEELRRERDELQKELQAVKQGEVPLLYPLGHFFSPLPDIREIKANEHRIFDRSRQELPGIDLRHKQQLELFEKLSAFYKELPFKDQPTDGLRYGFINDSYSYSDAICLYSMLRLLSPKKIIEVGSGYSSCVILDTNERFFDNRIACEFIDPYPEKLLSLIKAGDRELISITKKKLQDVDLNRFRKLQENDILFIDSTHVSKVGSDVNYMFFDILPALNEGVYVHFHDIFYPFEYPKEWVYEGRGWTEAYLLRTFLQYNSSFEIVFFNTFLEEFHEDMFEEKMPLCLKNRGGNIWIRRK